MKFILVVIVILSFAVSINGQESSNTRALSVEIFTSDDGAYRIAVLQELTSDRVVDSLMFFSGNVKLLDTHVLGRDSISMVYVLSYFMKRSSVYHDLYVYSDSTDSYHLTRTLINSYSHASERKAASISGAAIRGSDFIKSIDIKNHYTLEILQKENRFKDKYINKTYDLRSDVEDNEFIGRRIMLYESIN